MSNQIVYEKPDDGSKPTFSWGIARVVVTLIGLAFLAGGLFLLYVAVWSRPGWIAGLVSVAVLSLASGTLWVAFKGSNSRMSSLLTDMISNLYSGD